ncbi:conserved hypothetical protein [Chelatococcus asaccharovorans]|nr:conserved hypothetical protein [Chelatococcus asaccharovorans]CAH1674888.1 conserved hypothetical protein [Chelatococcus asaccharovorans]
MPSPEARSVRQGDVLVAVVDRQIEAPLAPVLSAPFGLGLFDTLPRGGNEVPPDVTRARKGRAAKDHQPRAARAGGDGDPVARAEDHHPTCLEILAGNRDRPFDDVDAPVFVFVRHRQPAASCERHVGVERLREQCRGGPLAVGVPEDEPDRGATILDHRQRLFAVVLECGRHVLMAVGQGQPCLDSEQAVRTGSGGGGRALRMGHAASGDHPVQRAGTDHLVGTRAVAVVEVSAIEIGDGAEADMRVGPNVDALTGQQFGRPRLVEEDEGPDHLPLRRRQGAPNLEAAKVSGPWNNKGLDGIDTHRVGAPRFEGWVPTHARHPLIRLQVVAFRAVSPCRC